MQWSSWRTGKPARPGVVCACVVSKKPCEMFWGCASKDKVRLDLLCSFYKFDLNCERLRLVISLTVRVWWGILFSISFRETLVNVQFSLAPSLPIQRFLNSWIFSIMLMYFVARSHSRVAIGDEPSPQMRRFVAALEPKIMPLGFPIWCKAEQLFMRYA